MLKSIVHAKTMSKKSLVTATKITGRNEFGIAMSLRYRNIDVLLN